MRSAFYILLTVLPLIFACKKKDKDSNNNNPGTPAVQNSFTLKKDGVNFSPIDINTTVMDTSAVIVELLSQAGESQENAYQFIFTPNAAPGTYPIVNGSCPVFIAYYYPAPGVMYTSQNGTFTINSHDTVNDVIDADFQFTVHNDGDPAEPVISDGSMVIHY